MFNSDEIKQKLETSFNHILIDSMQGMPILNNDLAVEITGVQEWDGRAMGVAITPWLMSLVLLPNAEDDWSSLELGEKIEHVFPSRDLEFMANKLDGLGFCQTYAIHSPMGKFEDQQAALEAAEIFMMDLMVHSDRVSDSLDQQRMQRYLDGEDMAQIHAGEEAEKERLAALDAETLEEKLDKPLSRRGLLSGAFLKQQS